MGQHSIELDYPVSPRPRFGHGMGNHRRIQAVIDRHRDRYVKRLQAILGHRADLVKIPVDEQVPGEPYWRNGWLPGLDGAALYTILADGDPKTYLEVGSGNSTKFARKAISDHGLRTRIISIDPQPRAECDALCDEVVRSPVEDVDLEIFEQLEAGDVLFVDNSHRIFTNSDAVVVFLDIIPMLRSGVLVEMHDIFLPEDYPEDWNDRFYSEQYVLAGYLLGGEESFSTELPCAYVRLDPELRTILEPLWSEPALQGAETHGHSYWVRIT